MSSLFFSLGQIWKRLQSIFQRLAPPALVAALVRQIRLAQEATMNSGRARSLRDSHGNRLRASAYGRWTGSVRRGGDLGLGGGSWLPVGAKLALIVLLGLGSFLGSSQLFIDYAAELPDAHVLTTKPLPNDTQIYAADNSLLADLRDPNTGFQHYEQQLDQMGKWLPAATVAIEDANFWNEPGIDPPGIIRAELTNLHQGRIAQGASTITQQLVKIRLLKDSSQNFQRKIKEAILAVQVDRSYSKHQILEMYLNSVEYGDFAIGSQAAAQNYFRKDTASLDLAEASMLAGIPQNPNYNSPFVNSDRAKARQKEVLNAMVHEGVISQDQADHALAEKLDLHYPEDSIKAAPQFVSWIVKELTAKYGARTAYSGGLHVTTTLNRNLQGIAEAAVTNNVTRVQQAGHNMHQGAMSAIDPSTGEVVAMVGSVPNQPGSSYNFAADQPLNPGSTVKLFTYTAAIASGKYTMETNVPDAPITINMPNQARNYQPKNYNSSSYPKCVLRTCLGNSLNIPAVYVEITTGVDKVVDMARQLGAPPELALQPGGPFSSTEPSSEYGAPFTLGGYPETPLLMSTATATIANMGVYHPATGILKVNSVDGTEIYKYDPKSVAKQVLDPKVAFIMAAIMSNNDNRKEIFGSSSENLLLPGRQVAAKTGTSEEFKDEWTLGFTPKLASAFWFGNPESQSISTTAASFDAIYGAAPGWKDFMSKALDALHAPNNDWYNPPAGLNQPSPGVWLLPGTDQHQPTPHLPSWASMGEAPKPDDAKPQPGGSPPPAVTPAPGSNGGNSPPPPNFPGSLPIPFGPPGGPPPEHNPFQPPPIRGPGNPHSPLNS